MRSFFEALLKPYSDENERSTARLLGSIVLFSIFGLLGIAVVTYFNNDPVSSVALSIAAGLLLSALLLLRAGRLGTARWLVPIIALLLVSYEVYAVGDGTREVQILGYAVVVLFATLLAGARAAWVFTALSSLSYTAILFIHKYELLRPYELADRLLPLDALVATIILVLIAYIQITIVSRLSSSLDRLRENEAELQLSVQSLQNMQQNLEKLVRERTEQIAVSAEVGRIASTSLDPDEVILQTVHLITERFGYYYAAIFLVDENGVWANLTAATGEAGQALLDRQHRLQVGGQSMVGAAIATRRPRIALDAGAEAVRFENPLLPDTRSEIALPLLVGNRVLGALDVQSVEGNAFDDEDIEVLQSMANQVAVAIDNARLYQESQARLESLNRLYRRELRTGSRALHYLDGEIQTPDPDEIPVPEALEEMQVEHQDDHTRVRLPFMAAGRMIGVMSLRSKGRRWTEEELDLLEAASSQVATALENALLVQDTEARARQERVLNEGTARIRETLDIEAILQTAATEIQRTLNLTEVEVQIGLESGPTPENGS